MSYCHALLWERYIFITTLMSIVLHLYIVDIPSSCTNGSSSSSCIVTLVELINQFCGHLCIFREVEILFKTAHCKNRLVILTAGVVTQVALFTLVSEAIV